MFGLKLNHVSKRGHRYPSIWRCRSISRHNYIIRVVNPLWPNESQLLAYLTFPSTKSTWNFCLKNESHLSRHPRVMSVWSTVNNLNRVLWYQQLYSIWQRRCCKIMYIESFPSWLRWNTKIMSTHLTSAVIQTASVILVRKHTFIFAFCFIL